MSHRTRTKNRREYDPAQKSGGGVALRPARENNDDSAWGKTWDNL